MAWRRLQAYAEKPVRYVVGLMSGTSVDGVDAALVRLSGTGRDTRAELIGFTTIPFPTELRKRILQLSHNRGNPATVSQANVAVGTLFAEAAEAVLRQGEFPRERLDAVASHGQTISHTPRKTKKPKKNPAFKDTPATLQIGEAAVIAQRLNCLVVSDFRTADVSVGGQGAPLVPYADWCLLTSTDQNRAIQNIGGIGNVTYLPANARPEKVIGFDTGPGNMLIDRAVQWVTQGKQTFDERGLIASEGQVDVDLLEWLLAHPFLKKKPPKSAGREDFGEAFWRKVEDWLAENRQLTGEGQSESPTFMKWFRSTVPQITINDVIHTLTAFTVHSIVDAYDRFLPSLPDEVIVGGGGSRNPVLLRLLRENLAPIPVRTHEDIGINSDAKEAIAFAVLANETLLGNPANLPSVTGADRAVSLGKITFP